MARHVFGGVGAAWRACKNSLHGSVFAFACHLQRNNLFQTAHHVRPPNI